MKEEPVSSFFRRLAKYQHLFKWQIDPKSGRIIAKHRECDDTFSPMEALAMGELGLRGFKDEHDAAKALGLLTASDAISECCASFNQTGIRVRLLNLVGLGE